MTTRRFFKVLGKGKIWRIDFSVATLSKHLSFLTTAEPRRKKRKLRIDLLFTIFHQLLLLSKEKYVQNNYSFVPEADPFNIFSSINPA